MRGETQTFFPLFVKNGQNPFKATLVSQMFIPTGFQSPHLRKNEPTTVTFINDTWQLFFLPTHCLFLFCLVTLERKRPLHKKKIK